MHRVLGSVSMLLMMLASLESEERANWWDGLTEGEVKKFEQVLGTPAREWRYQHSKGKAQKPKLGSADGRPVIVGETNYFHWLPVEALDKGTELVAEVRLAGEQKHTRRAYIYVGIRPDETIGKSGAGYAAGLGVRGGRTVAGCSVVHTKARKVSLGRGGYGPWLSARSLGWPESLRKRIEHDMAAVAPLNEKWLTMRWQILESGARFYLDDRLIWDGANSGLDLSGRAVISLSAPVEMRRLERRKIPGVVGPFEKIPLDACVNAGGLAVQGQTDGSDKPLVVGDIPFDVARTDGEGKNHLDIGKSWVKFASYGSRESPRRGRLGGRWAGLSTVDPSRILLAIPGGPYRALHLLAASDDEPDSVPIITAQFFRPDAGRPINFATKVPLFTAKGEVGKSVPLKLADGRAGALHVVTVPIDPGQLATLRDLNVIGLELTKEVKLYRVFPDPMYYSHHPAGLPSSVHVYGLTLERPEVRMKVTPARYADIWTAPEKPSYNVQLSNSGKETRTARLSWAATAHGGLDVQRGSRKLSVEPGKNAELEFDLSLTRHGYHDLEIKLVNGDETWTERRTITWLHADTRERGDWERGRGPIFGFWNWRGGHNTPSGDRQTYVMGLAGAESSSGSFASTRVKDEEREVARRFKMVTFKAFGAGDHYTTARFASSLQKEGMEKAREAFVKRLKATEGKASDIHRPLFISFFPEPHIGHHTSGTPPSYYGEPESKEFQFSESEQARFDTWLNGFVEGAKIIKELFPHVKCMLPHGDPTFPAPFLRRSKEVRELLDGVTVDIPAFERLPEQQLHQVSIHRMYICRNEFKKAGIENPWLPMYEGPALPSRPGALSPQEHADLTIRNSLILLAYGVDMQLGGLAPFDAGSYWGEQHYGGGMMEALPTLRARPTYPAFATMTRHLNRRNFKRWVNTGSLSVYCLEFRHYKSGDPVHVFWTLRGERQVTVSTGDRNIQVYDANDNLAATHSEEAGTAIFTVSKSPCFVHGLRDDLRIMLESPPDHSDARPGPHSRKLSSMGDGSWKQSTDRDEHYEKSHENFVKRFPSKMRVGPVEILDTQTDTSRTALSVDLAGWSRELKTMPFYTALLPEKPIVIPGKASHLGLWVYGSSDWGRVVYCLRDAADERWISVGTTGAWNCDDLHSWSAFCFDGWRYLRFELPANSPWDQFREKGCPWWGSYGRGDGYIDLPLRLEKVIIERRTHALYVNDIQHTSGGAVMLGDLLAEHADPADATDEVIRLSRLRMPVPDGQPSIGNPIVKLAENGIGAAPVINGITLPEQQADGTRCYVNFPKVEGAKHYDVWVSPYRNGTGALMLGKAWKEPGGLLRGLRPDIEFYLFATVINEQDKTSRPSKPYPIILKDVFGMK